MCQITVDISLNHWNDNNSLTEEEGSLCDVICRGDDVTGAWCFTSTSEGGANVSCCPCNCRLLKYRHASKVVAHVSLTLS